MDKRIAHHASSIDAASRLEGVFDSPGYLVYNKLLPTGAYRTHDLSRVRPVLGVTKQQVMSN